jgi:YVTN family beta-propeller protein
VEPPQRGTHISDLAGQRLGPYEIVEAIGRGGMAVVYKALQPTLRRFVAIKVLPPYFVHEEGFRQRFQQEAETVAQLQHPNILPIFDYGQEGEVLYIVMPLVTGGTLRQWLAREAPLAHAIHILDRILNALEYAHSQQVIHRDIKPGNILLSPEDWPLLADFGLAKLVEPSLRATRSGSIIGTPEYMAPEQSQGGPVDQRTDLYALGIILYEMLTGRRPFEGQTPMAVILRHIQDAVPSPRQFNPQLSSVWDEVIYRSLAKQPAERYPSARAMAEALQAAWRQAQQEGGPSYTTASVDIRQLYESARRARAAGDWQLVLTHCDQLLRILPEHTEAQHLRATAAEALERAQEQERLARLVQQGDEALAAERLTDAQACYEAALQGDPTLAGARTGLARVQEARTWRELYQAARAAIAAERWGEALARLDRLAAAAPAYRDVAALRAEVLAQQQRQDAAARWYERGLGALRRRDWAAAVVAFREAVAAVPGYRDAAAQLAAALEARELDEMLATAQAALAAGQPAEAVAVLETLLQRAPQHAAARTLLAQAQRQLAPPTTPRPSAAPVPATPPPATAQGARIYVTNRYDGSVSVVDAASHAIIAKVPVGSGPLALAVTPDGQWIYVTTRGGNRVQVLDAGAHRVVASVPVGAGPYGVAVHPAGTFVYVTNRFSGTLSVIEAGRRTVVASVSVGRGPAGLAASPDGERLYVANGDGHSLSVIATATNTVVATIAVGAGPEGVAVSPDGQRLYVANSQADTVSVLSGRDYRLLATVPVGAAPYGAAVAPDGHRVYVANYNSGSVSILDADRNAVVAHIPVERGLRNVAVSPDGAQVYVVSRGANALLVLDAATATVVATVPVGAGPHGIAVTP